MELVLLRELFEMEWEATAEGDLWTSHPGWNLTFVLSRSSGTSAQSSRQPVNLSDPYAVHSRSVVSDSLRPRGL